MKFLEKNFTILLLALFLAAGFEAFILTGAALWHDEAFSVLLTEYGFQEMIYRTGLDVHPPFYYILLKIWLAFSGDSLFAVRFFSLFFGFLGTITLFWLVREIFKDRKFALIASLLLAFNSFFIQFVIEARMFTLGIFLVILSTVFIVKALSSRKFFWWILYAVSASLGIYTHYYVFFSILAQVLFLMYWIFKETGFNLKSFMSNPNFKYAFLTYFLVALSFLPWLKTVLNQFKQVEESYWIPAMNFSSIPSTFLKMTTGDSIDVYKFWYILAILMIVVFIGFIVFLKKFANPFKWLMFLMVLFPFIGASLLSLKSSIYLDRYFIFTLPFYIIIISFVVWSLQKKQIKYSLIAIMILSSLITFPIRWQKLETNKKPGMTGAASYVNSQANPADKIYVGSSFVYFTFKYYNETGIYPKLYAPGTLSHFSGTALLAEQDIIRDFNEKTKKNDVVWMINTTGFGNFQPSAPANWIKLDEKAFQDVYNYRGWIIVTKYLVSSI